MPTDIAFVLRHGALLSLGIVFLLSAVPKLRRPVAFAETVVQYEILPSRLAFVFGLVLVPLEVLIAVAFVTGLFIEFALPVAATMVMIFFAAVAINLRRGRAIPCGCFGESSDPISALTMARLLLILPVVVTLTAANIVDSDRWSNHIAIATNQSTALDLVWTAFLASGFVLLGAWALNVRELLAAITGSPQPELQTEAKDGDDRRRHR